MPVVTISRQFGAGAKTLGQRLAHKLNYSFWDNELLQKVAEKAKVSKSWVKSVEQEAGGRLQTLVSGLVSKGLVDRILNGEQGYIDEKIYVNLLNDIINQIADEDNAVIIGRGGQYILSGRRDVFHFLLIAEMQDRVKFMQEHYNMTPKSALRTIQLDDRRRVTLYRKFHRSDYDQSHHYHMVLNTSRIAFDRACDMMIKLISQTKPTEIEATRATQTIY